MCPDSEFAATVEALLDSPDYDALEVACIPLAPALQTLVPSTDGTHRENVYAKEALAHQLGLLNQRTQKPWIAVVDSGEIYNEFVAILENAKIPTFRASDRGLRIFGQYLQSKIT